MNYSYVCVLSTNNYLDGILVLNENLKQLNSKYPLLCLINENINEETKSILNKFNIKYKEMNAILPSCMNDGFRWKYTFDKLHVFCLTEYEKIIYLDSDFLILENLDHLFDIDEFAMVYDYNPSRENYCCSALMVIKPNSNDYNGLVKLVEEKNKNNVNDIGDQDIINEYFPKKYVIPVEYNFIKSILEEIVEEQDLIKNTIIKKYKCKDFYWSNNPKIIHYAGDIKPFMVEKEFTDKYCYLYFYYLDIIRNQKVKKKQ